MSSSSSSSNTKKLIAVGAVAAVGVGGAFVYYKYRQQKSKGGAADEDTSFTKKPATTTTSASYTHATYTATTAINNNNNTSAARTTTTTTTATTTTTTRAPSTGSAAAPTSTSTTSSLSAPPTTTHSLRQSQPQRPPYVDFDKYYCRVRPAPGWEAVSEPSSMPNSAMIFVRRPEFSEIDSPQGAVPIAIITIEDVSVHGNTAEEVKDKSIKMVQEQMLAVTGGMIQPHIESSTVTNAGVFEYFIEMNQLIPGMMDMKTLMYITVRNGIAYSFQLLASPTVVRENKSVFLEMVKDFQIIDGAHKEYIELAYKEYHVNGLSVKTPSSWKINKNKNNNNVEEGGVLVEFTTSLAARPETITVYKGEDAQKPSATAAVKTSVVGGITVQNFTEGASRRDRRRIVLGQYTVLVVPQDSIKGSTPTNDLVLFAKSISSSSSSSSSDNKNNCYFVNVKDKYKCVLSDTGSVMCGIFEGNPVVYFPTGIEALQNGTEAPQVTIRCGHPDSDDTCASSLTEWRQRMLQEEKGIHIEDTTVDNKPAITFSITEMQETGPSTRSEVKTCVFITVRDDGSTCLIRWECDTGAAQRYERDLHSFLDSFRML